jgi:uncharacterized protein YjbI with pentapeptide repeats
LSTLFGRLRGSHRAIVLAAIVAVVLALTFALVWPITDLLAEHDVGSLAGPGRATQLQDAREAVRGQLLTLSAGLFAAGALVFTALNFTLSRRAIELTEQGQVTDRYTRAIEQLGSDKLDIRIGGTYALERVARDSTRDHPTVMAVLAAFVREHSREQRPPVVEPAEATAGILQERSTRPDVQAAITAIGRRNADHDTGPIDLSRCNLTGAHLPGANLANANLMGANLSRAYLAQTDLSGANLIGADLSKADLSGANLRQANLNGAKLVAAFAPYANLTGAFLGRADLTQARLVGVNIHDANLPDAILHQAELGDANLSEARLPRAKLNRANLTHADLTGADLRSADLPDSILDGTNLTDAELTDAWFSPDAVLPAGWACPPGSGRLARATPDSSGGP